MSTKKSVDLREEEAGALQIGITDHAMVRLIITTHNGVIELDFTAEEAKDIAEELNASAHLVQRSTA